MLIPYEHGTYGQLAFPLVTALAVGRPTVGAFAFAVAAFAAFLAHESLLVLLGHRGVRASREQRADAWRSLAIFGGVAIVSGMAAIAVLPPAARVGVAIPAMLAIALGVLVALRRERTTLGESLVAVTLSSVSLPIAIAAGASAEAAHTVALVFAIVFVTATICVRSIIVTSARTGPTRLTAAAVTLAGVAVLLVLAARGTLAPVAPIAALPVCAVAAGLLVRPPSPRRLRVVGWGLVGATTTTAALLIVVLRSR